MLDTLVAMVQPWADIFANNTAVAVAVTATHVLAIFSAGGLAIGADRRLLRASGPAARDAVTELASTHALVIAALVIAVSSGLLLLASDLGTFALSRVFWLKMSAVVLLMLNGLRLRSAESRLLTAPEADATRIAKAWRTLRGSAATSIVLWFSIVLLGVIVGNV